MPGVTRIGPVTRLRYYGWGMNCRAERSELSQWGLDGCFLILQLTNFKSFNQPRSNLSLYPGYSNTGHNKETLV